MTEPAVETQAIQGSTLRTLTSLRFYAAALVVFGHSIFDYTHLPVVGRLAGLSHVGVTFFFVLSGFILTWTARTGDTRRAFYRRRFARVYPMHALMALVALALAVTLNLHRGLGPSITNLLLVHAWVPDADYYFALNAPSWSLACEAFFYACFPLLLPRLRRLTSRHLARLAIVLWLGSFGFGLAANALLGTEMSLALTYVNPAYRISEFIIGICVALIMRAGFRSGASSVVVAQISAAWLLSVTAASGLSDAVDRPVQTVLMLPACVALIVVGASSDLRGQTSFLTRNWGVRLGQWSFSLYLVHWLIILMLAKWLPVDDASLGVRIAAEVGALALCVAASGLAYQAVERPLEQRLRRSRQFVASS